jgi:hypothetical protein
MPFSARRCAAVGFSAALRAGDSTAIRRDLQPRTDQPALGAGCREQLNDLFAAIKLSSSAPNAEPWWL